MRGDLGSSDAPRVVARLLAAADLELSGVSILDRESGSPVPVAGARAVACPRRPLIAQRAGLLLMSCTNTRGRRIRSAPRVRPPGSQVTADEARARYTAATTRSSQAPSG